MTIHIPHWICLAGDVILVLCVGTVLVIGYSIWCFCHSKDDG
jgi:hypothetical protein